MSIEIKSQKFHIIDINQTSQVLRIARLDLWSYDDDAIASCPKKYINVTLDLHFFNYTSNYEKYMLLYECGPLPDPYVSSSFLEVSQTISCLIDGKSRDAYVVSSAKVADFIPLGCKNNITVPGLNSSFIEDSDSVANVLDEGFEVKWSGVEEEICDVCTKSGGRCGYNASENTFLCLCPNQKSYGVCGFCHPNSTADILPDVPGCKSPRSFKSVTLPPLAAPSNGLTQPYGGEIPLNGLTPSQGPNLDESRKNDSDPWNWKRKLGIGLGSAVLGALAVIAGLYFYKRRKNASYAKSYVQSHSFSSDPSSRDIERGSQHFGGSQNFGVQPFTYTELQEATNNFDPSKELGEGGFGTVYYGKLHDGRSVAVKRLYENNYRRVEQFMNEVRILARLVHPNLVSLYGCTSRHSRELLLVYEYVSNGTVADHLHGKKAKHGKLSWHVRMNIAVETASALKYLHVSDIIHRDIKTNNILLDAHFRVKVADFGLSRLFPNDQTHVSTAPQGTPGYVDPEYHECYQLTDRSDVYSFGVVMIELISSLPAVDITRHRHEINLSNMAINRIQNRTLHEIVDPTLGYESDPKVKKMIHAMAELAFQCLQSSKDMRPSMDEVLETLKDIQSDGKHKSQPEVIDISNSADEAVLLNHDPPPLSPDSNILSNNTTPNASG